MRADGRLGPVGARSLRPVTGNGGTATNTSGISNVKASPVGHPKEPEHEPIQLDITGSTQPEPSIAVGTTVPLELGRGTAPGTGNAADADLGVGPPSPFRLPVDHFLTGAAWGASGAAGAAG